MAELDSGAPLSAVPRITTFAADKGGVGKTCLTVFLAATYALRGMRVVVFDLDRQRNATEGLLGIRDGFPATIEDVWAAAVSHQTARELARRRGEPLPQPTPTLDDAAQQVSLPDGAKGRLRVIPGDERIRAREAASPHEHRAMLMAFRDIFATQLWPDTDLVLIDTSPGPVFSTSCALAVSHGVVMPAVPERSSLSALGDLRRELAYEAEIKAREWGESLQFDGVVLTRVDQRTVFDLAFCHTATHEYGELIVPTVLPLRTRVKEAQSTGEILEVMGLGRARDREAADAFFALSNDLLRRWGWLSPTAAALEVTA